MEQVIENLKKVEREGRELLKSIPGFVSLANPAMVTKAQSFVDGVAVAVGQLEQLKNATKK